MTLGVIEFGRRLVETEDIDPIYTMLWKAEIERPALHRWLMAYFFFYHAGTASWIYDAPPSEFWRAMKTAAESKEYPRGTERRHFRGNLARNTVEELSTRPVDWYFNYISTWMSYPVPLKKVMDRVKTWPGCGDWIAFKVADMLERLDICQIDFSEADTFLFDSPKEGAELVRQHYAVCSCGGSITHAHNCPTVQPRWAFDYLKQNLGQLTAPPRHERKLNSQEFETILCKWKSHLDGNYQVGKDIREIRHALLRFARCKTAQRLLKCLPAEVVASA